MTKNSKCENLSFKSGRYLRIAFQQITEKYRDDCGPGVSPHSGAYVASLRNEAEPSVALLLHVGRVQPMRRALSAPLC